MSKPIRILQYIGSLNSGGSQSMIMNIYRNIDRSKIQFDFIVDRKNELFYANEIEQLGGKIYRFQNYFKGYNYLRFIREWNSFLEKNAKDYSAIHCHVRSVASIILRISKKHGLKTIAHSHNTSNGKGIKALAKKILQKGIPKYSDYLIACSRDAGEWLYGKKNTKSKNFIIINNAIDVKKYKFRQEHREEIRRKHAIAEDTYLVGHIGRFEKQKNHNFIIEIAKHTRNQNNIKYMLCGDGSLEQKIKETIKKNNLEDTIIITPTTKDIHKYYSAFDCFILPSLYEGLGMVLIEAQFSGLRCIVSPNVPEEAKISQNYIKEPLDSNKWAKIITQKKTGLDRSASRLLNNSSAYNIKNTINTIERLYLNCDAQKKEN